MSSDLDLEEIKKNLADNKAWVRSINASTKSHQTSATKSRLEQLHSLNDAHQKAREFLAEQQTNVKLQRELNECTFRPRILDTSVKMISRKNEDFEAREKSWNEKRSKKLDLLQKKKQAKDWSHCTFTPDILGTTREETTEEVSLAQLGGAGKHIERQEQARREKERVELLLQSNFTSKDTRTASPYNTGYLTKVTKNVWSDSEKAFEKLKNKTFGDAVLDLHSLLNDTQEPDLWS